MSEVEQGRRLKEEVSALEQGHIESVTSRSSSPSSDHTVMADWPTIIATCFMLNVMLNSSNRWRPIKTQSPSHKANPRSQKFISLSLSVLRPELIILFDFLQDMIIAIRYELDGTTSNFNEIKCHSLYVSY
jgi:hypothetical protein